MASLKHQVTAKETTLRRVFHECLLQKKFTGVFLSKKLSMSKPTINECLDILQNKKLIIEKGMTTGDLGRKAKIWTINYADHYSLALAVDKYSIKMALIDLAGYNHYFKEQFSLKLENNSFIKTLNKIILDFIKNLPIEEQKKIIGCRISVPGDISFDGKTLIYATNLQLSNISVHSLEEHLKIPVFFENEANAAALGEFYLLGNKKDTALFISISDYGVGSGHIVDGKLQKGANRRGGEIGHFTIRMDGIPCSCGNKGCFERYTSNEALFSLLEQKGFSYKNIDQIFADINTEPIIQEYCHYLGCGIRSLLAIFDANRIIIGGSISKYWDKIAPYILAEVFDHNKFHNATLCQIVPAKYGEHASLVGAGLMNFFPLIYDTDVYS